MTAGWPVPPIAKIDAHHHLWTLNDDHYPLLSAPSSDRYFGNTAGLKHEFGPGEFLALASPQNVVKSVYVESMFLPAREESPRVQAWSEAFGCPNAFIAKADLASPALEADLEWHGRCEGFRGLRLTVNWDNDPMYRSAPTDRVLRDPAWRSGYRALGQRGLIAEVMALPSQLLDLADLAAAHPQTVLVVNHAGMPLARTADEARIWREGMAALASQAQVSVKISGLGMIDHRWTTERIRPIVDETIEIFGVQRCLFGSNFPVDGLHATYNAVWAAFEEITAHRPLSQREALFHDNAARLYRI